MTEVRLALSNEALKTRGTPSESQISTSRRAIRTVRSPGSITQGPAIRASPWPLPILVGPMATGFGIEVATPGSFPASSLHATGMLRSPPGGGKSRGGSGRPRDSNPRRVL